TASTAAVMVPLPPDLAAGPYFLLVRADIGGTTPNGEIVEVNELNNIQAAALTVVRADLSVLSVTGPAVAMAGGNVSVMHVVKNLAAAAGGAPATVSRLYLSRDTTLDGSDVVLGDVAVGPLAGGVPVTLTKTVQIPPGTPPGQYWLIAQANATNARQEADHPSLANNIKAAATPIVVGP